MSCPFGMNFSTRNSIVATTARRSTYQVLREVTK